MARRRRNIVVEDLTIEALNEVRDAERRAMDRLIPDAMRELEKRGVQGPTGTYNDSFFAETDKDYLAIKMGNSAPHAHLVEYGTGPRVTDAGENRGSMPRPKTGPIRKAALAMRRKVFSEVEKELRRV